MRRGAAMPTTRRRSRRAWTSKRVQGCMQLVPILGFPLRRPMKWSFNPQDWRVFGQGEEACSGSQPGSQRFIVARMPDRMQTVDDTSMLYNGL